MTLIVGVLAGVSFLYQREKEKYLNSSERLKTILKVGYQ